MSRAFVKEDDGEGSERLTERPISSIPNYVTRSGLAALEVEVERLGGERRTLAKGRNEPESARKLKEVERDLRYFETRLETAKLVDHSETVPDVILFGADITVEDDSGKSQNFRLVGEDEADPEKGLLCWASPLADALLGKKTGETVVWKRPDGDRFLKIVIFQHC